MSEARTRLHELFERAVALGGAEREAFLAKLAREDPTLARELAQLVAQDDKGGPLASSPASRGNLAGEIVEELVREGPSADPSSSVVLEKLAARMPTSSRYAVQGEIARGGMGAILKVFDEDLRRTLAMKVILGEGDAIPNARTPPIDRRLLARFLEEAQVTGQLDHPGIVPVHELGLDADGRVYFTMKLVKGRDLKAIFELVFTGQEDWNETRALAVLLKVCEAVAYAHKKGVIHRDLKPANVMVGNFGEVYVMDWGLARVLGREDTHDIRLEPAAGSSSLRTERRQEREEAPDSPLFTMDGDVVGTPCYMPPEQARGEVERLGPRSDVYAIGAMLYHLLARQMPYSLPGARFSNRTVLARVVEGPPKPLRTMRMDVPAELEAICEKAMDRDLERRYADTLELSEDLRAYLEGRVVQAHRTGAAAELSKWVKRNRGLAAAMAAAVTALVAGLSVSLILKAQSDRNARLAEERELLAEDRRKQAEASKAVADSSAKEARWAAYVSSIRAADAALRSNEPANLRRALDRAPDEFRNWEWNHLNALADSSLLVLRKHDLPVRTAAYSPDGTLILTASEDKTVRMWDATNGLELAKLPGGGPFRWAVFAAGGSQIMTFEPGTVRVRDTASGRELSVIYPQGHGASISPDGSLIVTFSGLRLPLDEESVDRTLRLWDATNATELGVLEGHRGGVVAATFSPDGSRIASASRDATARIWDVATRAELAVLQGHGQVVTVAFSPDGSRIVSGSADGAAHLWDAGSGSELARCAGHEGRVDLATFSPDGSRIATGSHDHTARLWEAGSMLAVLRGHEERLTALAFSPDGSRVVTASRDKTVRIWDAGSGAERAILKGHESPINDVAFSPDGSRILTASDDGTSRIWDSQALDGSLPAPTRFLRDQESWSINAVAFSPDGARVAVGYADGTTCISDPTTGVVLAVLRSNGGVETISFSPDGSRIATGHLGGTALLWDADTGVELAELPGHESATVSCVAFSPDGKRLVTAQGRLSHGRPVDESARLWDAASGAPVAVLQGHEALLTSVAFSPDGRRLVTGSSDKTARLWDSSNGAALAVLGGHGDGIGAVAFSPDGSRIATGSDDMTARVWNAATGLELSTLRGHVESVHAVAFSSDGSRVVTASADRTVRVWSASAGAETVVLRAHEEEPAFALSPDGARIVTSSTDGTARIWDATRGDELAVLSGSMALISPDATRLLTVVDETVRIWDSVPSRARHLELGERRAMEPEASRVLASTVEACADLLEASQRIRADPDSSPLVRAVALDLLARAALEASDWVDALSDEVVFPEEMRARVEASLDRRPEVKKHARFLVAALEADPRRCNALAWKIVRNPSRLADDYSRALEMMEAATLEHADWELVNTLGVAQYRSGHFGESAATLERSIALAPADSVNHPADLAFLAMALFSRGDVEKAHERLVLLRERMKEREFLTDQECLDFLAEAESLIAPEGRDLEK